MVSIDFNLSYLVKDKNNVEYRAMPIPGDGNCLFSSISYHLFNKNINFHGHLRDQCVQYIMTHREHFQPFIGDIDKYLEDLSKPNNWGNHIEIYCLSEIYNLQVEIYFVDSYLSHLIDKRTLGKETPNNNTSIIKLMYYDGLHYWPLIPLHSTVKKYNLNTNVTCRPTRKRSDVLIEKSGNTIPEKTKKRKLDKFNFHLNKNISNLRELNDERKTSKMVKKMKKPEVEVEFPLKRLPINEEIISMMQSNIERLLNTINDLKKLSTKENNAGKKKYEKKNSYRKKEAGKAEESFEIIEKNHGIGNLKMRIKKKVIIDDTPKISKVKEINIKRNTKDLETRIVGLNEMKETAKSEKKRTAYNEKLRSYMQNKRALETKKREKIVDMSEKKNDYLKKKRKYMQKKRALETIEEIDRGKEEKVELKMKKIQSLRIRKEYIGQKVVFKVLENRNEKKQNEQLVRIANFHTHEELYPVARCANAEELIDEQNLGKMNNICSYCQSKYFRCEMNTEKVYSKCCHKGKSVLNFDFTIPELIANLLTETDELEKSKNFRQNIRQFNSALAFASFGAKNIEQPKGKGPYCFKVQGVIYHETSNLKTSNGIRKYAQLYMIDSDLATKEREQIASNVKCDKHLMAELDELIRSINCYAKSFKMLGELENEEKKKSEQLGIKSIQYSVWLLKKKTDDKNRYNLPVSNEIAAVFDDKEGCPPYLRDIEIHNRDGRHIKLSILSQHTDPMTYPLLYPYGGNGWYNGMKSKNGQKVTQLQYYAFLLSIRDTFSVFLHAGKLTQQFIVDAYCKMEANRLNYIRTHQSDLRIEFYQGLFDYLKNKVDNNDANAIGKSIILPSTFIGSPRNMAQNYQDAMTLVSRFGKPDLFITFTCNPKWEEIQENLEPYETVSDRPDLVSRVFHEKLKALKKDINENHIFGKVKGFIDVIEFQKRGLPHCHMLIILEDKYKIRNASDIDEIVTAEIPDPEKEPKLFDVIKSCMIHGPCGKLNQNSPCMDGGVCTKNYPKKFNNETQFNVDGYPSYRRRNDGRTIEIKNKDGSTKFKVDNRFIVPYNKYLSTKYNAHINVEVCSTIKSVKYLFKYVYKGHDCATVTVNSNNNDDENKIDYDEINSFLNARYVSAPEGCYRLFEFKMHDCSHAIIRLAIHLEKMQPVCFKPGSEKLALEKSDLKNTTLTGWFELNKIDPNARQYFYHEIPEHYVFTKKTGIWTKRIRFFNIIGRLYNVNIAEGERYFLRLMLLHQKGCKSFDELRTVDNVTYETFKEAAIAMKLLEDDTEWDRALEEAEMYQLPRCLRQLFATICIFCNPTDPLNLWQKHAFHLSEDFIRKYSYLNDDNETAEKYALAELNSYLMQHGKCCKDFQLPEINFPIPMQMENIYNQQEEEHYANIMIESLNSEQKNIYDIIIDRIYSEHSTENNSRPNKNNLFFIDAPGGTGKTFLYNTLMHSIRSKGDTVIPIAWTGIAASLLKGGKTVHSMFKLPVPLDDTSTSSLKLQSKAAQLIKNAKLILWDEVTMSPYYALDAIDQFLKELMNNKAPFGGKILLFGGDFMQCLPVVKHGNRVTVVSRTIKNSKNWHLVRKFTLHHNMRVHENADDYAEWILKIGKNSLTTEETSDTNQSVKLIELPKQCICNGNLIDDVFGEKLEPNEVENYQNKAILAPKNSDTLKLNDEILKRLVGECKTYHSVDSIVNDESNSFKEVSIEFLNSLTPSGMPPHKLNLKIGAIIMLLRNINGKLGLCNGTRLSVIDLRPNIIKAKILTGEKKGQIALLPRIILEPSRDELPFQMRRVQFPIRLSFSITINKAQGQTFENVGLFLPQPVFSHGQLYVALSRARSYDNLKIKLNAINEQEETREIFKQHTYNIVYPEIFSDDENDENDSEITE